MTHVSFESQTFRPTGSLMVSTEQFHDRVTPNDTDLKKTPWTLDADVDEVHWKGQGATVDLATEL